MALTEAEELELLELEAEAAQAKPAKKRKKRKRSAVRDLATSTEATLRGAGRGALGAGDPALALNEAAAGVLENIGRRLTGQPTKDFGGFSGALARQRARSDEVISEAPIAGGAGTVAGAVATPGGATLKAGQRALNLARTAGQGGTEAAVTEAGLGGSTREIAQAAAIGTAASPAVRGAIKAGGAIVQAGRSLIDRNRDAGFRALAKALTKEGQRVNPKELQAAAEEFKRVTGRTPTVAELVGARGGQDILETVQAGNRATETLLSAAERRVQELQDNLAGNIERGRSVPAVTKLQRMRDIAADRAMQKIENETVQFDPEDLKAFTDNREVLRAIPEDERLLILELEDSGGVLTVRQVENIRQALSRRSKGPGGAAKKFRDFGKALVEDATEQVPQFGRFLRSFKRRSKGIEGAEFGRRVVSDESTTDFIDTVENLTRPGLGGARTGARVALSDEALSSPQAAAQLAGSLAEDAGLERRLQAIDPTEAARLQEVGQAETGALRSVAGTVRGAQIKGASQEEVENTKAVIETLVLSSGRASGGFQANFASRLIQRFKVPPTAAQRLAEAVTDPDRTNEAIRILNSVGVAPKEVEQLARAAQRATTRAAAPALAEGQ